MNKKLFAIILSIMVIVDSYVTVIIGTEINVIYLWFMDKFNLTLGQCMFWRIPIVLIMIKFIYDFGKENSLKYGVILYFLLYAVLVGLQFYQYF